MSTRDWLALIVCLWIVAGFAVAYVDGPLWLLLSGGLAFAVGCWADEQWPEVKP